MTVASAVAAWALLDLLHPAQHVGALGIVDTRSGSPQTHLWSETVADSRNSTHAEELHLVNTVVGYSRGGFIPRSLLILLWRPKMSLCRRMDA